MSSFFKNFIKENSRETSIKELLINTLSENAKEVQFECKESGKDYLELIDCTNSLSTTIEAIFLHGLKDSLLWQTMNVISGDVDRRPEPNFWPVLLVFLHKQVIENIHSLSQITTEIGYCRCWIRLSLNESLLSSYLNNIKKNLTALYPYYKKTAFIRDTDNLDVASKLLEGVETCCQINLPINSSLLNHWTNYPLQLAGIWSPPLKSCPISSGVDVASAITDAIIIPTPKPLQANEVFADSIPNSPFKTSVINKNGNDDKSDDEDKKNDEHISYVRSDDTLTSDLSESEHLKVLLQKIDGITAITPENNDDGDGNDDGDTKKDTMRKKQKLKNKREKSKLKLNITNTTNMITPTIGNSVQLLTGWSLHEDDNRTKIDGDGENSNNNLLIATNQLVTPTPTTTSAESELKTSTSRSNSMNISTSSLRSPIDHHSYNTLLVRHENSRQLDWNDVWAKFESSVGVSGDIILSGNESTNTSVINEEIGEEEINKQTLGFEIVPQTLSEKFTLQELQNMVKQMFELAREKGLDSQGFVCKSCSHPLGVGFAPAQVCVFSGNYFCTSCISLEPVLIPAKIIYNWDFHKYSVSKRAALFLLEFQNQPFIDLKILNPDLYKVSDEMSALQLLRIKLNFIRAYLFTCRESIIDNLQKFVWPKEYLYEHIHQYSIADLIMIQKGTLQQLLQKIVQFGETHILNCRLCSVKGFICEICNSPKVLYPFHIETTFRCELCGAVFHAKCLNDSQPCPKCERKKRREDLPLLEAVDML